MDTFTLTDFAGEKVMKVETPYGLASEPGNYILVENEDRRALKPEEISKKLMELAKSHFANTFENEEGTGAELFWFMCEWEKGTGTNGLNILHSRGEEDLQKFFA